MKRALVLGGGGVIGVAWESGLVNGLRDAGFDPASVDAIVGTSAGGMVGAQLAADRVPRYTDAEREARALEREQGKGARSAARPNKLDYPAIGQIFKLWAAMGESTPERIAAIGAIVRGLDRSAEEPFIAEIEDATRVAEWPALPFYVNAVDTETGTPRAFTREDGVPLRRVLAASAAVPGLFPAIEIDGRLYMDGQVHSGTNADLLLPHRPAQVLIAAPTNAATGSGIGGHADRMLEREVAALRAAGCDVRIATPTPADAARFGTNLMDATKAGIAYEVGYTTGRSWAAEF